jgi:hypothetical protein
MHIVPRFDNDELKQQLAQEEVYVADPADRVSYAEALRGYLDSIK